MIATDTFGFMLAVIALGLSMLAYHVYSPLFAIAAGAFWLAFSLLAYGASSGPWDIYYITFWFSMGLSIGVSIEAVLVWNKKRNKEMVEKEDATTPKLHPVKTKREKLDKMRGKNNDSN